MTPEQVAMVQENCKSLSPIAETTVDAFCARLFGMAPHIREMFPQDMKERRKKQMVMLALAVVNPHDIGKIIGSIRSPGYPALQTRRQGTALRHRRRTHKRVGRSDRM